MLVTFTEKHCTETSRQLQLCIRLHEVAFNYIKQAYNGSPALDYIKLQHDNLMFTTVTRKRFAQFVQSYKSQT